MPIIDSAKAATAVQQILWNLPISRKRIKF